MLFYIIRHGHPDYGTDSLTERGRLQALAVGKRLSNVGITHIYSSPQGRARQTAQPLCDFTHKTATVLPWAHEMSEEMLVPFPDGQMRSFTFLPNGEFFKDGGALLTEETSFAANGFRDAVGIEPKCRAVWNAVDELLAGHGYRREGEIYRIERPNEDRIALFCHNDLARVVFSHLVHVPIHTVWASFSMSHTGVTVLELRNWPCGETVPRCLCFDDLSHLAADNQALNFDGRLPI